MKRVQSLLNLTLSFLLVIPSASAVENGVDAKDFEFVVPIRTQWNATLVTSCSGVLLAPSVVATAGHCVLDSNQLLTEKIYVGDPGSSSDSIGITDIISGIQLSGGFKSAGDKVPVDDIVFLVLSKPKKFKGGIRLPAESEIVTLKAQNAFLRVFGYGVIDDSGTRATTPFSTQGYFSSQGIIGQPDSGVIDRLSNNLCKGDSGGPVLSISAKDIILVGITTGMPLSKNCGSTKLASFTLASRYSNLAFGAAVDQMVKNQIEFEKLKSNFNTDLEEAKSAATTEIELTKEFAASAAREIEDANDKKLLELFTQIEDLKEQVKKLQARLPSTIFCFKGKESKKVTGVNPKCPTGYKKK